MNGRGRILSRIAVAMALALLLLACEMATGSGDAGGGGGNAAPSADAGVPQNVSLGSTVLIDGSGSSDPDGDQLSASWRLVQSPGSSSLSAGSVVAIPGTLRAEFVPDVVGNYTVELIVQDPAGLSDQDTVDIAVSTVVDPTPSDVALLQSLEVRYEGSPLTLTPTFAQSDFGLYSASVPSDGSQVEIVASALDSGAAVSGDTGVQSISPGANAFTITVTAEDTVTTQDYTINVNRPSNATLASLTVDGVSVPAFDAATFVYTITKPVGTTSITIGATPAAGAAVTGGTGTQAVGVGRTEITVDVESGPDSVAYVVRIEVPPTQVVGLSASDGTNPAGVSLSWSTVPGADSYRVERQNNGVGAFVAIDTVASPSTSYLDDSTIGGSGAQHQYRVVALADGVAAVASASDAGRAGVGNAEVTITFEDPDNPTITLGGGIANGDFLTLGTNINFTAAPGYDSYSWSLNGVAAELAEGIIDTDGNTNTFTSSITGVGTFTVGLVVSDLSGNLFSAQVTFTVVQS